MTEIATVGLDLAKHVFQVHATAMDGTVVLKKRLRRGQLHACARSVGRSCGG
jgi:transposase